MVFDPHLGVFLISEQIFCCDFAVENSILFAFGYPEWRNHGVDGLIRGLGRLAEDVHPLGSFIFSLYSLVRV